MLLMVGYLAIREPAQHDLEVTAGGDCSINARPVVELRGDEVGVGLVRLTPTRILLERVSEIVVFDRQGRFQRVLGKPGSGPGEFRRIQQVISLPDEHIAVFQANPPLMTVLDSVGTVLHTTVLPVSISRGGAIMLRDGSIALTGDMRSDREHFGHPIARMTQNGELLNHFGRNEVETEDPLAGRMMPRVIAPHPSGGVVAVKQFKYAVELWNSRGTIEGKFARKAEWLNWPPVVEGDDPHTLGPPEDMFRGAEVDDKGRLWLVAQTTPADWKSGLRDGRVIDRDKWTDTQIEVVDLASKRVICSSRFKPFVLGGLVGPQQIASYRETAGGDPIITVWSLSVQSPIR